VTVTERDKRALIGLAAAVVISLTVYFWPQDTAAPDVVETAASAESAGQRLERVRRLAAQVPGRQQELNRLRAELEQWEAGVIRAETSQQAQAEIVQVLRRIGSNQVPPLEFSSVEMGQVRPLGSDRAFGEALVSVSFNCVIEQLVNLMADLTAQTESVVTEELRVSPLKPEEKSLRVRLTVAGLVPGELLSQQRGVRQF